MITVKVNVIARPGKQHELMQSIRELKDKIASETGCAGCRIYQDPDKPDEFVVFEQWNNEKLAHAHLDSENLAVLVGAASVLSRDISVSLSKEPSIEILEKSFRERLVKKAPNERPGP